MATFVSTENSELNHEEEDGRIL